MSFFVGFDMGGTSIKHVLIDSQYTIVDKGSFKTLNTKGASGAIEEILHVVDSYASHVNQEIKSVGIGCTGPIDTSSGIIYNPYTLPGFEGHSLRESIEKPLGIPVFIDNDSNTAHYGELVHCKLTTPNSLMITFGTGIGVSARLDGSLYRTPGNIHPEIGHMTVSISSPGTCYCGRTHCFEHIMSGTAINTYARNIYGKRPEEVLEGCNKTSAEEFLNRMVVATTDAISTLAMIFSSETVFIGGGLHAFIGKYVLPPVQEKLTEILPVYGKTTLVEARMGPFAGSYGAAILAAEEI